MSEAFELVEVLLVEDNPGDVRLTREALSEGKIRNQLSVVDNGEDALTFLYRRIAAVVTVAACVLCLPVYLEFIAPGPFRWVVRNVGFKGEWKTFLRADFAWDAWAVAGIVSVAIALYVCLAALLVRNERNGAS